MGVWMPVPHSRTAFSNASDVQVSLTSRVLLARLGANVPTLSVLLVLLKNQNSKSKGMLGPAPHPWIWHTCVQRRFPTRPLDIHLPPDTHSSLNIYPAKPPWVDKSDWLKLGHPSLVLIC